MPAFPLSSYFVARSFNHALGEWRDFFIRNGNDKSPAFLQFDFQRGWFYFNPAFAHTHIKRHSGLDTGFATYISWDDKSSGRVDGTFHTIENTMTR